MNSMLFPKCEIEVDSPRLKWIKRLGLTIDFAPHCPDAPFACWQGDLKKALELDGIMGFGRTQDEAVVEWAKQSGVPLWNETAVANVLVE